MSSSRGLRNNNPLNIRLSKEKFEGEIIGDDRDFKTFVTMAYGYRAAFVILYSYLVKGVCTISGIIRRWAPSSENDTEAYIAFVSKKTGIDSDVKLEGEDYKKTVSAMSWYENGIEAVEQDVEDGFKLQKNIK